MANSNNRTLFYGAIIIAILALILCVYYVIPGVYHVMAFSGDANSAHPKHAIAFGALAVVAIIGALVTRPKPAVK